MNVGSLGDVMGRIGAIESRFARPSRASAPSADVTAQPSQSFGDVLDRPVAPSATSTVGLPEPGRAVATPIPGWTPPQVGQQTGLQPGLNVAQFTSTSGAPVTELDRLAAAGLLLGGAPAAEVPATDLDAATHGGHVHASGLDGAVAAGTPFAAEFERAGATHGVPPRLLAAVGWVESRYQTDALSPDGAIGVMQIMPMTAKELGVNPHDPVDAIDGAARLLASHERKFGSWDLALAAYHSGAGGVSRNGNQPPPRAATYVGLVNDRLAHA